MTLRTATQLEEYALEDLIDAYVDWEEQSQRVWLAYGQWTGAPPEEAPLRFAAYVAELDQEQRACEVFAATIARTMARLGERRDERTGYHSSHI